MTFMASEEALLVSGAGDGSLVLWSADHGQDSRELVPKLRLEVLFSPMLSLFLLRSFSSSPSPFGIGSMISFR
ncbi:hypothetical protein BT93_H1439 [Corymbia citriodora subsp. variegata]|nr:hypothetical protein BT93_H1439 [Corymbia citriodora subsp. variegata]